MPLGIWIFNLISLLLIDWLVCQTLALSARTLARISPLRASVIEGRSITLECRFNHSINCSWSRNSDVVKVNFGRYHYESSSEEGINTATCSLVISSVKMSDSGLWECGSKMKDANQKHLLFHKVLLIVKRPATSIALGSSPTAFYHLSDIHPQDVNVIEGASILLKCDFKMMVNCTWQRNNNVVKINAFRYHFKNTSRNGTNTTDCSIEIYNTNRQDSGLWTCANKPGDSAEGIRQKKIRLKVTEPRTGSTGTSTAVGPQPGPEIDSTLQCPEQRLGGLEENILLGIAIASTTTSLFLAILAFYQCWRQKKSSKKRSSVNSQTSFSEDDKLISLPTIGELRRIESIRVAASRARERNEHCEDMEITTHSGKILAKVPTAKNNDCCINMSQMNKKSQQHTVVSEVGNSSGYLIPSEISNDRNSSTSDSSMTSKDLSPVGHHKYGQLNRSKKEPIYDEVK